MWCPRCEEQGKIVQQVLKTSDKRYTLWSCFECEAAWEEPRLISKKNLTDDEESLARERWGLDWGAEETIIVGDFWLIWYDKLTEKFVGKSKLNIKFEEPRHFGPGNKLVTRIELQGISLEDLLQAFDLASEKRHPTVDLYTSVQTLNAAKAAIFQRCTEIKIDLSKYYYFVEFDSEIDGKIGAESENYPAIFVPRQVPGFFDID